MRQVTLLVGYPGTPAGITLTQQEDGQPFFADDGSGLWIAPEVVAVRPEHFDDPDTHLKAGEPYFFLDDTGAAQAATLGDNAKVDDSRKAFNNVFRDKQAAADAANKVKKALGDSADGAIAVADVLEVKP